MIVTATTQGGESASAVFDLTGAAQSWPDDSNTGVPAGTTLTFPDGGGKIKVTTPGAVLDSLDVTYRIEVAADNVTISNCRISSTAWYRIWVRSGVSGTLIEDCTIYGEESAGKGILLDGQATVRRANISGQEDGIFLNSWVPGIVVEDCYIHHLYRDPGSHIDCIQIRYGDDHTVRRNNLQAYNDVTGDFCNSAIQVGSLNGTDPISNFVVEGNLMNGGNYTVNGGGDGDSDSAIYRRNQFGRDYRYGIVTGLNSGDTWDDSNVWDDTGLPV